MPSFSQFLTHSYFSTEAAAGDDYTAVSGIFTITDNNPRCVN